MVFLTKKSGKKGFEIVIKESAAGRRPGYSFKNKYLKAWLLYQGPVPLRESSSRRRLILSGGPGGFL